jgi:hypothetical protein
MAMWMNQTIERFLDRKGGSWKGINRECTSSLSSQSEKKKEKSYCETNERLQFSKFLIFVTDGMPLKFSKQVLKLFDVDVRGKDPTKWKPPLSAPTIAKVPKLSKVQKKQSNDEASASGEPEQIEEQANEHESESDEEEEQRGGHDERRAGVQLFPVVVPGAKYSHAIYSSYLSGTLPTNYGGKPLESDHLLASIKRSQCEIKTRYVGPRWSFLMVTGEPVDRYYPAGVREFKEELGIGLSVAYPFFFMNKTTSREFAWDYLPDLKRRGDSLVSHSGVFDHIAHGVYRHAGNTKRLDRVDKDMAKDFRVIKHFVRENPDYLLVLMSDHGVDDYTADGQYVLHGFSGKGNDGYMLLYNPRLHSAYKQIDTVDVAPTLASYLCNVDIPASSIGITRAHFGPASPSSPEAAIAKARALQRNVAQLSRSVRHAHGTMFSTDAGRNFQWLLAQDVDSYERAAEFMPHLEVAARRLKALVFDAVRPPTVWALCALIGVAVYPCAVLIGGGTGVSSPLPASRAHRVLLALVYALSTLLSPIGFVSKLFRRPFASGAPLFLPSLLLGLVATHFAGHEAAASRSRLFLVQLVNWLALGAWMLLGAKTMPALVNSLPLSSFCSLLLGTAVGVFTLHERHTRMPQWRVAASHAIARRSLLASMSLFGAACALAFTYSASRDADVDMLFPRWALGFHVAVFALYFVLPALAVGCAVYFGRHGVRWSPKYVAIAALAVFLHLLNGKFVYNQLALIALSIMYLYVFEPVVAATSASASKSGSVLAFRHVVMLLAAFQTFFVFVAVNHDNLTPDVRPFVGTIGFRRGYDLFPTLSAVCMASQKFGIFILGALHMSAIDSGHAAHLFSWMFTASQLSYATLQFVISRQHAYQECFVYTATLGALALLLSAVRLVELLNAKMGVFKRSLSNSKSLSPSSSSSPSLLPTLKQV